ncbi:unnamed protein product [Chrysoparadoxa australica]
MDIYTYADFNIELKGDESPLTKADIASHDVIVKYLNETGIPVLSEEGKDLPYSERKDWNTLWIVDPIDGTKEFIKKNGEFTVNIALVENGLPILGVVLAPALDVLYYGAKGIGSFKVDLSKGSDMESILKNGTALPMDRKDGKYVAVASRSHMSEETVDFITDLEKEHGTVETVSMGSSLKICLVAEGVADCYPRFAPTMEWDTAAGHGLVAAAGKTLIDWETKQEMQYNREKLLNNWFLVQ